MKKSIEEVPEYCVYGVEYPGYHCMFNQCPYVAFTEAPYEIAFSGAFGEVNMSSGDDWIGFGGDMEPLGINSERRDFLIKKWKQICINKVREAYMEYMDEMEGEFE